MNAPMPRNFHIIDRLIVFAEMRGHTLAELAIAWLLGEPMVSCVIAGVSKVEHVTANARASEWNLIADELAQIRQILEGDDGV